MKRLGNVLLSILLVLPMFVGMCFLMPEQAPATLNGGGANSLNSPETNQNDPETNDEYVVTYKTYEDYFIDLAVPSKFEETTIDGEGTANSHYVVNSTADFLFLCKKGLYSKYIDLNCDIILNEETFDENGTPSGGDGVVYLWADNVNATEMVFDGRGFNIRGVYNKNLELSILTMFSGRIRSFKNVNYHNVFFQGKTVLFIATQINNLENVNTYEGTIKGTGSASAFVNNSDLIENCDNYFDVYTSSNYCAAFITRTDSLKQHSVLRKCSNHGKIEALGVVGGLVGSSYQSNCDIYDCTNYGEIICTGGTSVGAFFGIVAGKTHIVNCKNYGSVFREGGISTAGAFVGQYINDYLKDDSYVTKLVIKNCYVELDYLMSACSLIFGNSSKNNQRVFDLYVDNIEFNIKNLDRKIYLLIAGGNKFTECDIRNIKIDVQVVGTGGIDIMTNVQKDINISNVLVFGNFTKEIAVYQFDNNKNAQQMNMKSLIISGEGVKQFYGSDFSGFYFDWKDGKIGLKGINIKGFFQKTITENMLIEKGYIKKKL